MHEFHHSATEMTLLNIYRDLPLVKSIIYPITIPLTALTSVLFAMSLSQNYQIPVAIFILVRTIGQSVTILGHSSLKVIYPKPISLIFFSPACHWIHHSINKENYDKILE